MKIINTFIYCVCVCWSYDEYDIIFCSYSLDDCKSFVNNNKKIFRYSPTILIDRYISSRRNKTRKEIINDR